MNSQLLQRYEALSEIDLRWLGRYKKSGSVPVYQERSHALATAPADTMLALWQHNRFLHNLAHTHPSMDMIYTLKGKGSVVVSGQELHVGEGQLIFLKQNVAHEYLPIGAEDIVFSFAIWPQFFYRALEMIGPEDSALRKFLLGCLRGDRQTADYMHFKASDCLQAQNLVENLLWSLTFQENDTRGSQQFTMGLLLQLLNMTDNEYFDTEQSQLANAVMRYVETHYADGSLAALAQQLCYDVSWLSRSVKQTTGRNFSQLLQEKRISQAKLLLSATDWKVADIAREVGYKDASPFYRLFLEQTGCSPNAFRQGRG